MAASQSLFMAKLLPIFIVISMNLCGFVCELTPEDRIMDELFANFMSSSSTTFEPIDDTTEEPSSSGGGGGKFLDLNNPNHLMYLLIAAGSVLLVCCGAFIFYVVRSKKKQNRLKTGLAVRDAHRDETKPISNSHATGSQSNISTDLEMQQIAMQQEMYRRYEQMQQPVYPTNFQNPYHIAAYQALQVAPPMNHNGTYYHNMDSTNPQQRMMQLMQQQQMIQKMANEAAIAMAYFLEQQKKIQETRQHAQSSNTQATSMNGMGSMAMNNHMGSMAMNNNYINMHMGSMGNSNNNLNTVNVDVDSGDDSSNKVLLDNTGNKQQIPQSPESIGSPGFSKITTIDVYTMPGTGQTSMGPGGAQAIQHEMNGGNDHDEGENLGPMAQMMKEMKEMKDKMNESEVNKPVVSSTNLALAADLPPEPPQPVVSSTNLGLALDLPPEPVGQSSTNFANLLNANHPPPNPIQEQQNKSQMGNLNVGSFDSNQQSLPPSMPDLPIGSGDDEDPYNQYNQYNQYNPPYRE